METFTENINDRVVWQGLKAGDKTCFNRLFRKYYSELFYYGIKTVSNTELVKESIQEVFMRVWETRNNLADVENVKSYLLVSVKRMILLQQKKHAGRENTEIGLPEAYSFYFDLNEFEKHEELSEDLRKTILTAINSLTRKQRELIFLFFYHELDYSEIATILDISIPAVRNLMYRTLLHLRETIGEKSIKSMKSIFFLLFSNLKKKKAE